MRRSEHERLARLFPLGVALLALASVVVFWESLLGPYGGPFTCLTRINLGGPGIAGEYLEHPAVCRLEEHIGPLWQVGLVGIALAGALAVWSLRACE